MFKVMVLKRTRLVWEVVRVFRELKEAEDFVINLVKLNTNCLDDIKIMGL